MDSSWNVFFHCCSAPTNINAQKVSQPFLSQHFPFHNVNAICYSLPPTLSLSNGNTSTHTHAHTSNLYLSLSLSQADPLTHPHTHTHTQGTYLFLSLNTSAPTHSLTRSPPPHTHTNTNTLTHTPIRCHLTFIFPLNSPKTNNIISVQVQPE